MGVEAFISLLPIDCACQPFAFRGGATAARWWGGVWLVRFCHFCRRLAIALKPTDDVLNQPEWIPGARRGTAWREGIRVAAFVSL